MSDKMSFGAVPNQQIVFHIVIFALNSVVYLSLSSDHQDFGIC